MRARTILIIAGGLFAAKMAAHRHYYQRHGDHHHGHDSHHDGTHGGHHGSPCGHGPSNYLEGEEWRGLTADEARTKLEERHGTDSDAIERAIAYLEERGYLAAPKDSITA